MPDKTIEKDFFSLQYLKEKPKRIAIFASYDAQKKIADYVVYYLRELKKVVDAIIFIADNPIKPEEAEKIKDLVAFASFKKHGCYDFGSYKRGYELAKEKNLLDEAEELLLCNDSCYGPVFPFSEMFEAMGKENVDFWGMVRSLQVKEHLQSYFILFKKKVFTSQAFVSFINGIEHQNGQHEYVLKYEVNLTELLHKAGFKYSSYLDVRKTADNASMLLIEGDNPTTYPLSMHQLRISLIKKKAFFSDFDGFLKESIVEEFQSIRKLNPELFECICKDIVTHYEKYKYELPEWIALAKDLVKTENILFCLYIEAKKREKTISEEHKKQMSHRSVRWALTVENFIDKTNRILHLGKYNKKNKSIQSQYQKLMGRPVRQMSYEAWLERNPIENHDEDIKMLWNHFIYEEKNTFIKLGLKCIDLGKIPLRAVPSPNKKIAVHLHIFYEDMTPLMASFLSNVPVPFDLFVSIPEKIQDKSSIILKELTIIKNLKKTTLKTCPNRGRDISPLICTFGKELLEYDYIGHFHSKKSLHTPSHNAWAAYIFNHLLGSTENVSRILYLLDNNIGMVSPPDFLLMTDQPTGWGGNIDIAQNVLKKGNLKIDLRKEFPIIEFPQGSMFWARTSYLTRMFNLPLSYEDFPEEPIGQDGTLAHALERLFFVWGMDSGMESRQIFINDELSKRDYLR